MFGQGLALRILDREVAFRTLNALGMPEQCLKLQRQVLELPHGVFLVTGPTGSGKTTTLYAMIKEINAEVRKIITVEDPIEYQLDGVMQIQVRDVIGLSFHTILRHILRHDPDVIMIGEIRDTETARIAISAAMTGHLVFSTLHTNDAPSAPVRLLEMGVEPYLVASSIEAVLAQRLLRVLCPACKKVSAIHPANEEEKQIIGNNTIYEPQGCPACRNSGYNGRTGLFEMFVMNDTIRQFILERTDAGRIRNHAVKLGMNTLRLSGLQKVAQGLTDIPEVYRVARLDHDLQMAPA
jgi:type II secretory ATPase GspE/PulE/Tfp pilus assembly ATPase PilB-like protein